MTPVSPNPRAAEFRFALFYLTAFALFGVYMPYFQRLLRLQGFHEKEIGFIVAAIETVGIVAPPAWGWFSHRVPYRRRIIAAALLGAGACFIAFGRIASFPLAVVMAVGFGFFYRPIVPLSDGLRLRYMAEHGGDYGRLRALGSLSFTAAIVMLEGLGVAGDAPKVLILGGAGTCAVIGAASALILPTTGGERAELADGTLRRRFAWSLFARRPLLALGVVSFLNQIGMAAYYGFFTLYLEDVFSYRPAGFLWILAPLAETPVIYFSSAIIARVGVRNMLALGVGSAVVRLIGYSVAPGIGWIIPLQLMHAFTFGAFHTASIHYIHRLVPPDMKQGALAVYSAWAFGLASIVGNALGGVLVYHAGFRAMFAAVSVISLIAFVALVVLIREPPES